MRCHRVGYLMVGLLLSGTTAALCGITAPARADVLSDSVNINDNGDSGAYWGAADVGWLYSPASSYELSGIKTKFSIPNLTTIEDRTVTVDVYQNNTPSNGGTLLGSFSFNSSLADNNTLGGGDFVTPISLTAGETYFIGFENVGPGPDSTGPNIDDLGVNFTADAGATFLSNLHFDSAGSGTCAPGTFACEDSNQDILGQPILAFYSPSPTSPVPEPSAIAVLGAALFGFGLCRVRPRRDAA